MKMSETTSLLIVAQTSDYVKFLFDNKDIVTCGSPFYYDHHLSIVNNIALKLAEKYGGDLEVVSMGALLHDIGMLYSDVVAEHDVKSIEVAQEYLTNLKLPAWKIDAIVGCIRTHGCKENMPSTIEEKIVATSDGLSHLITPWYLVKIRYSNKDISELFKWGLSKSVRDYKKIQFDDERQIAKKYVNLWSDIFSGNLSLK